ncbi:SDR family oxidoreductase [Ferruginibacter albus]|uniref:SDR family oxidoreductase n=1 Tax=Ferruginibacter albus TaxID=2875540 RepID=UPI001CC7DB65|nr:NAD(P)H-binding protein [Ferruginibacter albus]UAY50969.1 NAD(P)H-binding protein [Ferruginibacter albus]
MKIAVTGSLGHISKPLTIELIHKGHTVTVISSNPQKQKDIEALGAIAAIGSIEDTAFLTAAFTGADAVYCMEPPVNFFDQNIDIFNLHNAIANNYVKAIEQSGVKHVVHLSSIGAHTDKGNGMLAYHYYVEKIFEQLPTDIAITTMRPVGFYYNLLAFIRGIKTENAIITNYGDLKEPWVSPIDIAAAIAEEITQSYNGRKVRYVASDELTCNAVAQILGTAISKPNLQWTVIPDEQLLNNWLATGVNATIAKGYVEMNAGRRTGVLYEDYYRNRPVLGKTKLVDFAKEFAAVYNQQ